MFYLRVIIIFDEILLKDFGNLLRFNVNSVYVLISDICVIAVENYVEIELSELRTCNTMCEVKCFKTKMNYLGKIL